MDFSKFAGLSSAEALEALQTTSSGLSDTETETRTQKYGKNQNKRNEMSALKILLRQFKSPFTYLLLAAFILAILLGEPLDGVMIAVFVTINTLLGFIQEYRSEATARLLEKYLVSTTKVRRAGEEKNVESSELVPGDIIILEPGDIVPADARVIEAQNLSVDESVLTGESAAAFKVEKAIASAGDIFKAQNILFSGTTIVSGVGQAVIFATAKSTVYADVVKLAAGADRESPFEKGIGRFSKFILWLVICTLAVVVIANLLLKKTSSLGDLLIFSVALAVSVIPEALPVVTTFSLSLGARKLARKKVVVKRLSSIEDLGSIQVLCSDKTGTLTENTLKIEDTFKITKKDLLLYASLASDYKTISRNAGNRAFEEVIFNSLNNKQKEKLKEFGRLEELPFDPIRKRTSALVENEGKHELIVRGAFEEVMPLVKLDKSKIKDLEGWVYQKGREGIRVLAVSAKSVSSKEINIIKEEKGLSLLGLIAFKDPVKSSAKFAISEAKSLGVEVKILTGDSKEVAEAVSRETGILADGEEAITGEEFEKLDFAGKHTAALNYKVFARVTPEQKYKIIEIMREDREVGFLGEGINDSPALKISDVGLVVKGASDVAREAADIILLDKSLSVIIEGIKEGRVVYANTNKYITATLSANFGNFFAVAIVSLVIDFLPMLPLQILLVNLLSDFPMISIAADKVDKSEIEHPKSYSLKNFAFIALLLGVVSTFYDFVFFSTFNTGNAEILQTSWFIGSILTELVFIYSIRTKKLFFLAARPPAMIVVLTGVAIIATLIIPFTAFGQEVFKFIAPSQRNIATIGGIVLAYFATTEIVKVAYYRWLKTSEGSEAKPALRA